MPLADHEELVQTLLLQRLDEPLDVGVQATSGERLLGNLRVSSAFPGMHSVTMGGDGTVSLVRTLRCGGVVSSRPEAPMWFRQDTPREGLQHLVSFNNDNGGIDLFGLDRFGSVWHRAELVFGLGWGPWQFLGGPGLQALVASGRKPDGAAGTIRNPPGLHGLARLADLSGWSVEFLGPLLYAVGPLPMF